MRDQSLVEPEVPANLNARYLTRHSSLLSGRDAQLRYRRCVGPELPPRRGSSILELGCGQVLMLVQVSADRYQVVLGVEISPEEVAMSHQLGIRDVELPSINEVLSTSRKWDSTLESDVLAHLNKVDAMSTPSQIPDSLRRCGSLAIRVSNAATKAGLSTQSSDLIHQTAFSPRSVNQAVSAVGFVNPVCTNLRPSVVGWRSTVCAVAWHIVSSLSAWIQSLEGGRSGWDISSRNFILVARKPLPKMAKR